jgi:hypothetical protein
MTGVVVLFGEGDPPTTMRAVLGDRDLEAELVRALGPHRLTLVCTAPAAGPGRVIIVDARRSRRQRLLDALGAARVARLLRASAPGRLVLSLSPMAASRQFRRAVSASLEARAEVASADVLIAADLAAAGVAWHSARRTPRQRALWGLDQALRALGRPSAPS